MREYKAIPRQAEQLFFVALDFKRHPRYIPCLCERIAMIGGFIVESRDLRCELQGCLFERSIMEEDTLAVTPKLVLAS